MSRVFFALIVTTIAFSPGQLAHANWFKTVKSNCKRDFHRNNCWPQPFNYPDRVHVRNPHSAMAAAGWRCHNLLGDYHFKEDSTELTTAGELKVREILTQSPPQYRTVFVQRGGTRDATAARLDAIDKWTAEWLPEGAGGNVQDTHLVVEGTPAPMVDFINVRFRETLPSPQLPANSGGEDF